MSNWYIPQKLRRASRAAKVAAATNKDTSDMFTLFCLSQLGREPVREYRFHPVRKWRFDYAFPDLKIAVECDGGVFTGGRHTRPIGYMKDMEKFNAAAQDGWVVLKFTPLTDDDTVHHRHAPQHHQPTTIHNINHRAKLQRIFASIKIF